jgi:hypothetical protein
MNTQDIVRRLFVPKNPIVIGVISCDHHIVKFFGAESGTIYIMVANQCIHQSYGKGRNKPHAIAIAVTTRIRSVF